MSFTTLMWMIGLNDSQLHTHGLYDTTANQ